MDKEGLQEIKDGAIFYSIGSLFLYIGIFLGMLKAVLVILGLLIIIFGVIHTWNGFSKISDEFKDYEIGKIGSVLTIIIVGFIILGIVEYLLGEHLKNDNIKIGGLISIFFPFVGQLMIYLELNDILNKSN